MQRKIVSIAGGRGDIVTAGPAALTSMAIHDLAHVPRHLVADGTTLATARFSRWRR